MSPTHSPPTPEGLVPELIAAGDSSEPSERREPNLSSLRRTSFDSGRSPPTSAAERLQSWETFLVKRMGMAAAKAKGYVTAEEALDSVSHLLTDMGALFAFSLRKPLPVCGHDSLGGPCCASVGMARLVSIGPCRLLARLRVAPLSSEAREGARQRQLSPRRLHATRFPPLLARGLFTKPRDSRILLRPQRPRRRRQLPGRPPRRPVAALRERALEVPSPSRLLACSAGRWAPSPGSPFHSPPL